MNRITSIRAGRTQNVFWGEIAPCDHMLQLYDDDAVFLDSLEGFVAGGLASGDALIVIATPQHLASLEERLQARGMALDAARREDRYIALDAQATIARFMVGDWPDDQRFRALVRELLVRARGDGRRVRAFGEMVALMWARGLNAATVRLEHLWHQICHDEDFALLCAYPKSGFTIDAATSLKAICDAHATLITDPAAG